ncbi:MAG: phospholipase/Carboxylesterase [Cyanobacteria bacterium RYN_339]|nr:phospholipase/Carboxylesterase [Cyanobacteria bacterium RYN_339]
MDWKHHLVGTFSWQRVLRSAIAVYVLLVAYLYLRMDAMVFQPQPSSYHDERGLVKLACPDGRRITAVWLPNPQARFTLLYSHGNAEDLGENLPLYQHLHDLGFAVLGYDYHGYGTSEGVPGERTSELDIEAAYAYLTGPLHVPPTRLIAYGRSVGGGPTLALASRHALGALILESTFTDPASVLVPVRLLPWVMFPCLERLKALKLPVLVMHGEADDTIPVTHGRALFAAATGPKWALWVPGAGHDDFKQVAGKKYDDSLRAFAQQLGTMRL